MGAKRALWRVDEPAHVGCVVTDDDDRIIVAENLSPEDARLIAAAPELLQELKALLKQTQEYGYGSRTTLEDWIGFFDSAEAVIAKAEGSQ